LAPAAAWGGPQGSGAAERGEVTGWGCGSATTGERALAETLFEARVLPQPGLPRAGTTMGSCYVADMGFSGLEAQQR
jgi:hypothetical protein